MVSRLGLTSEDTRYHDPAHFLTAIKEGSSSLLSDFDNGRISPREFFERLASDYRLKLSFEEFVDIWNSGFRENHEVSSLILQLSQHVRLFLLSNTNELHFEHLQSACAVIRSMEAVILSYRVGCQKPSEEIYQHALEVAGLSPDRVWYVDDIPEFVDAANGLGIHGIQYSSPTQLKGVFASILKSD